MQLKATRIETSINELKSISDEGVVEKLFNEHYSSLCRTVFRIVKDKNTCEDIVQDVFVKMWNKRHELNINISVKSYLFRSAINTALNYVGASSKMSPLEEDIPHPSSSDAEESYNYKETESNINKAIDSLPPACKMIFVLSRHEELSYKEIAESLQISVKTVENQMGKALKILRIKLKDYLLYLIIIWLYLEKTLF